MSFDSLRPIEINSDKLWLEGAIVLDSSAALDIFRLSSDRRDEIFNCLNSLRHRLWLPDQVRLEFHRSYESVLSGQMDSNLPRLLDGVIRSLSERKEHPWINTAFLIERLKSTREDICISIRADGKKYGEDMKPEDRYRLDCLSAKEKLFSLFEKKIGSAYKKSDYLRILGEIETRYRLKIPPGYRDEKKTFPTAAFGDALIWYQIIDHAIQSKTNIIMITADLKSDWWDEVGRPRQELQAEFRSNTGQEFMLYKWKDFYSEAVTRGFAKEDKVLIQEFDSIEKEQSKRFLSREDIYLWTIKEVENKLQRSIEALCLAVDPSGSKLSVQQQMQLLVKEDVLSYLQIESIESTLRLVKNACKEPGNDILRNAAYSEGELIQSVLDSCLEVRGIQLLPE